jgi:hypothetical protein
MIVGFSCTVGLTIILEKTVGAFFSPNGMIM